MSISVKEIEQAITNLPPDQLEEFRAWYESYDAEAWDTQIENDIVSGRLDAIAEAAIADHKAGKSNRV